MWTYYAQNSGITDRTHHQAGSKTLLVLIQKRPGNPLKSGRFPGCLMSIKQLGIERLSYY